MSCHPQCPPTIRLQLLLFLLMVNFNAACFLTVLYGYRETSYMIQKPQFVVDFSLWLAEVAQGSRWRICKKVKPTLRHRYPSHNTA